MWFIGAYIKIAGTANTSAGGQMSSGGIAAVFFFYLWTACKHHNPTLME